MSAYDQVAAHLALFAARLGTPDPRQTLDPLLRRSFALPLGDPRYRANHLAPGLFPLELSWSERTPGALRLGLDPSGPTASAGQRLEHAHALVDALLPSFGAGAADAWAHASSPFADLASSRPRYGAGVGIGLTERGIVEVKVYYETGLQRLSRLPRRLVDASRTLASVAGPLMPRFTSVSVGLRGAGQRVYLLCGEPQTAARLEQALARLELGDGARWVTEELRALFGASELPRGSVMLTVKAPGEGPPEIRVLVMTPGLPAPPRDLFRRARLALAGRPASRDDLDRWVRAFTPPRMSSPGAITVLDLRCTHTGDPALSLYFTPAGFALPPARTA
jgi:hypothetical protein